MLEDKRRGNFAQQPTIITLLARPRKECCAKVLPVPILVDVTLSEVKRAKPVPRFKDPI